MFNLVIIGMGNMGSRYLQELQEKPIYQSTVYGVQTGTLAKAQEYSQQYPNLKIFTTFEGVLKDSEVSGILIATPNELHYSMAKDALLLGKHVVIEKPAALTEEQIQDLSQLAKAKELICEVMFQSRFDPLILRIKELLPEIGKLQRFQWDNPQYYRDEAYFEAGNWSGTWGQDGGGILLNQAIHQIDLMNFFFGMPSQIVAKIFFGKYRKIEVDDEAFMIMSYDSGLTGTFMASFNEPYGQEHLLIVGENGFVEMKHQKIAYQVANKAGAEIFDFEGQWQANRREVISNMVQASFGKAEESIPVTTNIEAFQVIHGAWLSAWKNSWVELPLNVGEFEKYYRNLQKR